ncbi:MAG: protein kinase [Planctomycetota bacterium]
MLTPGDQAILAAAVQRGFIAPGDAERLGTRYGGPPGQLGAALVHTGALSAAQHAELLRGLSGVDARGLIGPVPPSTAADKTTPGTHRWSSTPGTGHWAGAGTGGVTPGTGYWPGNATPPAEPSGGGPGVTGGSGATASLSSSGRPGRRLVGAPTIPGIRVEEELGRGGMGAVFKGIEEASGRAVAIKVLLNAGERQIKRFEREAQAMQRLKHEWIIELVAAGTDRGQPYIVMEYVTGGDLEQARERGLPIQRTLEVMAKVARAVDFAHGQGILHRDLKPANVLLDAGGDPRVTDFGLAKILDRETQLTRTNAVIGTPYYMAPEQVRGTGFTEKTDVYMLGVILYELLTGEYPCNGASRIELYQAIQHQVPAAPHQLAAAVPPVVSALVMWAIEKDQDARPSCRELGDVLEDLAAGRPPRLLPPSLRRPALRLALRAAAALLGLLLLAGAGYGLLSWRREVVAAQEAAAAVEGVEEALGRARRARGRDLAAAQAEVEAYREAARLRAEVPARARDAADEAWTSAGADERRVDALQRALRDLLAAGRPAEAAPLAREAAALLPERAGALLLLEVLSQDPAGAAEAHAQLARLGALRGEEQQTAGEALLRMGRAREAALALEGAAPPLRALRARAWRLAGELQRAEQELRDAAPAPHDPLALPLERARVQAERGQAAAALRILEKLKAGGDARWHATRAALLVRLGRPGAALAALAQAIELDPAWRGERGRVLFAEGHRQDGELELAAGALPDELHPTDPGRARREAEGRERDPAAELDLALARWASGDDDEGLAKACARALALAERFAAGPALGAAAARWLSLLESSRGRHREAVAAAERARALAPGSVSDAALAWALWLAGEHARAAATLGPQAAGADEPEAVLRCRLELAARAAVRELRDVEAARQATAALPALYPLRASLSLTLAQRARAEPQERAALSAAAHRAWQRGASPPSVPVASRAGAEGRAQLVARLYAEASLLTPLLRRPHAGPDARARVQRLLARVVALEPEHLAALALQATLATEAAPLDALTERFPALDVLRRARVRRALSALGKDAEVKRRALLGPLRPEYAALSLSPRLETAERIDCAWVARRTGEPQRALALLLPVLDGDHRDPFALDELLEAARELKQPPELLARIEKARGEVAQAREELKSLIARAQVSEGSTMPIEAARALKRMRRDLPLFEEFHRWVAESQFGEGAWALADLSGGEYIAGIRTPSTTCYATWLYAFGWNERAPQQLVFDLAKEELARRPDAVGPYLGQAIFLAARSYLRRDQRDPEDMVQALRLTRQAAQLEPGAIGPLTFTLNLLVSAERYAEAEALADHLDQLAPRLAYTTYQRARLHARNGRARECVELLSKVSLSRTTRRLLLEDPSWDPIKESKEFVDFLNKVGIK